MLRCWVFFGKLWRSPPKKNHFPLILQKIFIFFSHFYLHGYLCISQKSGMTKGYVFALHHPHTRYWSVGITKSFQSLIIWKIPCFLWLRTLRSDPRTTKKRYPNHSRLVKIAIQNNAIVKKKWWNTLIIITIFSYIQSLI